MDCVDEGEETDGNCSYAGRGSRLACRSLRMTVYDGPDNRRLQPSTATRSESCTCLWIEGLDTNLLHLISTLADSARFRRMHSPWL